MMQYWIIISTVIAIRTHQSNQLTAVSLVVTESVNFSDRLRFQIWLRSLDIGIIEDTS
ncbi:hypothetical protein PM8797T_12828 [Gimesia maris DSM 8797]|nr:hypothetical protein PM8797T_12828 [Gimesia maris DSM 8797]